MTSILSDSTWPKPKLVGAGTAIGEKKFIRSWEMYRFANAQVKGDKRNVIIL